MHQKTLLWAASLAVGLGLGAPSYAQSVPCPVPQAKKKISLGGLLSAAKIAGLGGNVGRAAGAAVEAATAVGAETVKVGSAVDCGGSKDRSVQVATSSARGASTPPSGGWPSSAGALARLSEGDYFPYDYLVQFWRTHPPGTTLSNEPNDTASGYVEHKPGLSIYRANVSKSEAALIERKLTVINDALLALPPLKDIRGSSLLSSINISQTPKGRIEARLRIGAYYIDLSNPKTENRNGRYHLPGEPVMLTVEFNAPLYVQANGKPQLEGSYNGLAIERVSNTFAGYVATAPRSVTITRTDEYSGKPYEAWNPDFFDTTARPSDLQLLTMKVGLSSVRSGFSNGRHPPTSGAARLLAALFMADWNDIVRRVQEVH